LSFDENTQTMNVEARDWLETGEIVEVRGYLLPVDTVEPVEKSTPLTVMGFEVPVRTDGSNEGARLTERLNEAYRNDHLEPQEREFLDLTREHFSRLAE
jgi:hypothetical protein